MGSNVWSYIILINEIVLIIQKKFIIDANIIGFGNLWINLVFVILSKISSGSEDPFLLDGKDYFIKCTNKLLLLWSYIYQYE